MVVYVVGGLFRAEKHLPVRHDLRDVWSWHFGWKIVIVHVEKAGWSVLRLNFRNSFSLGRDWPSPHLAPAPAAAAESPARSK